MRRTPTEKPDTPEILDQTHVALRRMWHNEQITEDIYHKNLVSLAARWILLGRIEDANAMVCELSPDYVAHSMPYQMQVDPDFRTVANSVSASLSAFPLDADEEDVELALLMLEKPKAQA